MKCRGKFVQGWALLGTQQPRKRLCNILCTQWLPFSEQGLVPRMLDICPQELPSLALFPFLRMASLFFQRLACQGDSQSTLLLEGPADSGMPRVFEGLPCPFHSIPYHTTLHDMLHATPCHATPNHNTPCHTTQYHTALYHTTLYYATPHQTHTMPHHTTPHNTTLYHTTPHHTMPHRTIEYHTTSHQTAPYHTIP